jgi:two-component system cell cycle sensor histidine kinase/response regulator CckA
MADTLSKPRSLQPSIVPILALQLVGIAWLDDRAGSILSHTLEIAAASLAAGYGFAAYRQAHGAARRFWLFVSIGLAVWVAVPIGWIYYQDWLQLPIPNLSVEHFLPLVPGWFFAMALGLNHENDEEGDSVRLAPQTVLDSFQIAIVLIFLNFTLYYLPARGLDSGRALTRLGTLLAGQSFALLTLSLVRLGLTGSPQLRKLYGWAAFSFGTAAISSAIVTYFVAYQKISPGAWTTGWLGLAWTVPLLLVSILTSSHQPPQEGGEFGRAGSATLPRLSLINIVLALGPLVIAEETGRLQPEWRPMGFSVLVLSTACYVGRLVLSQKRLACDAEEHRESLVLLRAVTEGTTDAIFVKDLNSRYLMINSAGARILNRRVQDIIGREDAELFPPNIVRQIMARDRKVVECGNTLTYLESEITGRPDRVYLSTLGPYHDARNNIIGLLGISRDITEHDRAEKRFRSLVQGSSDLIITVDAGGVMRYVSPSAERVLGYSADLLPTRNLFAYVHPEDLDRFREFFNRLLREAGFTWEEGYRLHHSDGSWAELWVVGTNLLHDSSVQGIVINCRDISAQTRAEKARVEAETRYRTLVEQLATITYVARLGLHGEWLYVSPQIEGMLGFSPSEWQNDPGLWISRVHPEDRGLVEEREDAAFSGKPFRAEYRMFRRDGTVIWVNDTAAVVPDSDGNVLLQGVILDVSERKHLETQLRQAQKMQAIGRLAGGIAHDFNNLLTVILGYAHSIVEHCSSAEDGVGQNQFLQDQGRPDRAWQIEVRRSAERIRSAADRATALTRQLLAFGRRQMLEPRVLNLNSVIAEMDKVVRRLITEDIEIITRPGASLGSVKADAAQIEQVILNLVINARDAMPEGGVLTIETSNVELDRGIAEEHVEVRSGPYVMLAISDTGTGMDAETQARIFEPFFTTKETGKGTGLGLSTVYGIVEQSEGYIWVNSEPNRGSSFKVFLPRVDEPAQALHKPVLEVPAVRGTERILLVEDDAMVRDLAQSILSSCGYSVLAPEQIQEVGSTYRQYPGRIDLLLTDVVMPGISGRDLARQMTAWRPDMKVLYISGYTDNAIVSKGFLDPGIWFLQKPFTPATLAAKVREVLDHPGKAA